LFQRNVSLKAFEPFRKQKPREDCIPWDWWCWTVVFSAQ